MGKTVDKVVRDFLQRMDIAEGSKIPPERELSELVGLPRGQVRRTLAALEAEGVIWRHVGRGTFLGPRPIDNASALERLLQSTSPAEVMEARKILEPSLAQLAAYRANPDEFDLMANHLKKSRSAPDVDTYERWDGAFHRAIAVASRNRLLLGLFDAVNDVRKSESWADLKRRTLTTELRNRYSDQHDALLEAMRTRDSAKSRKLMLEHLEGISQDMERSNGMLEG